MWRRYRPLWILLLVGGFVLYAGHRSPMGPQEGVGLSWPGSHTPVAKDRVRVAIYNIHRGKGTDGVRDLRRTASVLRGVDVVGLNEVGGPAIWGGSDQADRLGDMVGMGELFVPNQRRWFMGHFGNGLLSRLPVDGWTSRPLVYDRHGSQSYRSLLSAETTIGGQPVTVMVTHLDRGKIRPTQRDRVLAEFRRHWPAILIGDLNTDASDVGLQRFLAEQENVDAIALTLGESDDGRRIDWIITRGLKVLAGGVEPVGISDHPCYWVDVELMERPGPAADPSSSAP